MDLPDLGDATRTTDSRILEELQYTNERLDILIEILVRAHPNVLSQEEKEKIKARPIGFKP